MGLESIVQEIKAKGKAEAEKISGEAGKLRADIQQMLSDKILVINGIETVLSADQINDLMQGKNEALKESLANAQIKVIHDSDSMSSQINTQYDQRGRLIGYDEISVEGGVFPLEDSPQPMADKNNANDKTVVDAE